LHLRARHPQHGAAFMAGGIDIVNRMTFGEPITAESPVRN
jgi:hypothetical protein